MDKRVLIKRGMLLQHKKTKKTYKVVVTPPKPYEDRIFDVVELTKWKCEGFTHEELCENFNLLNWVKNDIDKMEIKKGDYGYYVSVTLKNMDYKKYLSDKGIIKDTAHSHTHNGWFKTKEDAKLAIEYFLSLKSV